MAKTEIEVRVEATNKTRLKYAGRPFAWGSVDCVKMARFHALAMGHKPPRFPSSYTTEIGALRALKKSGFENVDDLLSSMFPKIPLASARVGDFIVAEGEAGLDAVFISLGRKIMGFHEEAEDLVVVIPEKIKSAYRV